MSDQPDNQLEVLRELYLITERRRGAVYRTQYVRDVWVPMDWGRCSSPPQQPDHLLVVKSSDYAGPTIRRAPST